MNVNENIERLRERVGHEVGVSPWILIDQGDVNQHAETTGDTEWFTTDEARTASAATFDTTIVPGFLLLSQLTRMSRALELPIENAAYLLNYGFDRVRIVQPVPVGTRVQGRFELTGVSPKGHHGLLIHLDTSIWMADDDIAPATVAEWLVYARIND